MNLHFQIEESEYGPIRKLRFGFHPDFVHFIKTRIDGHQRRWDKESKMWIIYTDFYDRELLQTAALLFDQVFLVQGEDYKEI